MQYVRYPTVPTVHCCNKVMLELPCCSCDLVLLRPSKKKDASRPDFCKKKGERFFFCNLLFPIACFLYTLLPFPKDTLELLGQILIKRNIRY